MCYTWCILGELVVLKIMPGAKIITGLFNLLTQQNDQLLPVLFHTQLLDACLHKIDLCTW